MSDTIGCGDGPEADIDVWTLAERAAAGEQMSGPAVAEIAQELLRLRPIVDAAKRYITAPPADLHRVGRIIHDDDRTLRDAAILAAGGRASDFVPVEHERPRRRR